MGNNIRILTILAFSAAIGLTACGGAEDVIDDLSGSNTDDDSSAGGGTDSNDSGVEETVIDNVVSAVRNYFGAGSRWDVSLDVDELDFTITHRDDAESEVDLTISGSYESLDSGFLLLTVEASEGDGGPEVGDKAFALEAPGYAFFLKPLGGTNNLIPMINTGGCPTEDFDANWVMVKTSDEQDASGIESDYFGTFTWDYSENQGLLPAKYAIDDSFTLVGTNDSLPVSSCEDGVIVIGEGDNAAEMFLTSDGGAIVHTQVNLPDEANIIFALKQKEITDISNLDGDYAGFLFDDNMAVDEKIHFVSFSCSSGTCTGMLVVDVEENTTSTDSVTVTLDGTVDGVSDGLVTGTITSDSETGNLVCMADIDAVDSGRQLMSCVGQSPGDNSKMFNVILVSKEAD